MKVAIISFDVKYIELLKEKISEIELLPYGDTISFLKDSESEKPDIVIYDATSGIFAEDDLKYLLNKEIVQDKQIIGLVSPENQLNSDLFEGKVLFFDKLDGLNDLISMLSSIKTTRKEETEINPHEYTTTNLEEFQNLADFSETLKIQQPSLELEQFAIEHSIDETQIQNIEVFQDKVKELYLENDIFDSAVEKLDMEEISSDLKSFPIENSFSEEFKIRDIKGEMEQNITAEKSSNPTLNQELGGEMMVANFNIKISEEEIKELALKVAREFLEKDPAMEKIMDHLQIDFQEEARKELEVVKNELKGQLRKEAEAMMKQEIEKLIKEELKDYVAEITAKIVKEKLEQVFKSS